MEFLVDVEELKNYIIIDYYNNKKKNICNIRLQRTLYLLYAYWSSFEENMELFDADFEAWKYGPVIPGIYHSYKAIKFEELYEQNKINKLNIKDDQAREMFLSFYEDVVNQCFDATPFALVGRTHEDKVWKDSFEETGNKMGKNGIINEYKSKQ